MTTLVAIDPGTNITGIAFFRDGALTHASAWKAKKSDSSLERFQFLVEKFRVFADTYRHDEYVIEYPMVYKHGSGAKADPDDVLAIARLCGGFHGRAPKAKWRYVRPAEWKGQVPKKIMNARVLGLLTPGERECIEDVKSPDALDACGLGMFALGRMR